MRLVPPQSMIQLPTVGVRPAPRPMAAAAPPAPSATGRALDDLAKLADLKARGVITDEEFTTLKARILAE